MDVTPHQKLNKWRPKNNIALITPKDELELLTKDLIVCKKFHVLFTNENILRLKLL